MRKTIIIISALAILTVLTGCQSRRPSEVKELTREEQLQRAVERNYRKAEPHYELGVYYMQSGMLERAESEFYIALNCDPVYKDAQAAMVSVQDKLSNPERSKLLAETYIDQARNNAAESFLLGRAFQRHFYEDYAVKCYHNAERLAPESAVLNKYLGYYYLRKGDKAKAESYLTRSFHLDPYQPDVSSELGKLGVVVEVPPESQRNIFQRVTDPLADLFKREQIKE
jgi:Flp pilus assembly protein TadD